MTDKTYNMKEIADLLGGELHGDSSFKIIKLAHPFNVSDDGDLALAMDKSLFIALQNSKAKAAIISDEITPPKFLKSYIVVGRSRYAMSKLTAIFERKPNIEKGIHKSAVIEDGAKIADGVSIGAFSYICSGAVIGKDTIICPNVYVGQNVSIGKNSLIYSGVRFGSNVKIGDRSIIHFNSSIGSDGFSFVTPEMGSVEAAKSTGEIGNSTNIHLARIASLGSVEIGDDVEIGSNTSIDKGTIISTTIGNGTKIDNQVQIGHNVQIGENCMLCGRVGIAGSSKIGNRVVLGGGVAVSDHVEVGDDVVAMGLSGIAGNVHSKTIVGGTPAKPRNKFLEDIKNIARIKYLSKKIKLIMDRLDKIENNE